MLVGLHVGAQTHRIEMLNKGNTQDETFLFYTYILSLQLIIHTISLFCSITFFLKNMGIFGVRSHEIFRLQQGEV